MKHPRGRSGLISWLGRVPLVCVLAAGASAPLGCSSDDPASHGEAVGTIGVNLQAAPGVTLNSVTYSITGNGFSKTGAIDTSGSPVVSGTIGGIPAGKNYTLTLEATSAETGLSFSGSAKFDVAAGETSAVTIHLKASGKTGNGNVAVTGSLNVGPVIDELTVTPLKVFTGNSVTLKAVGSDGDDGPSPLTYYWSTTGGVIDTPVGANATLTSSKPGTFTVKLTVSDGELTDTASTTVSFVNANDGGEGGGGGSAPERPNILLIIADDYGAEASSLYPELAGPSGNVPVPNIEALAEDGLVFDNAWASPVCSPTRGTIVSGLYGYRTGVTTVGNVLPTSTVTLFDRLTAEAPSYEQALFGKYHLGGGSIDPRPGGAFPDAPKILQHVRDLGITNYRGILGGGLTDYFNWTTFDINGPNVANTTYATTALTDFAIDYIHQHEASKPNEPWFLYQAYNGPHAANGGNSPYQVPPADLHHVDLSSVGNPAPGTYVTNVPVYQANIQALDTEVGRLLKEVDLEKTVVIFIGDNGVPGPVKDGAKTGIRGSKGSAYEGGLRVPLVVTGAGVTRRGREDDLFVTTDLYASILNLAGVPVTQVNDSFSIKPLLSDETATNGREYSFSETSSGTSNRRFAVKDRRFKLVYDLNHYELYDLVADPLESQDLSANSAYAAVLATLQAQIAKLRSDTTTAAYFP